MSRRREFEIVFGSDSFLDVIANIVGILIILIVIAGVRVGRMPVAARTSPDVSPVPTAPAMESSPTSSVPNVIPESESPDLDQEPEPLSPLPELVPTPELVVQLDDLQAELATIDRDEQSASKSLRTQQQLQANLQKRIDEVRELIASRQQDFDASVTRSANEKRDLTLAKQTLRRLLAQLAEAKELAASQETLQHRVTPISRTVVGKEKHYRLDKNRVAEVPIEVLVTKLKAQIERRGDWLVRTRSHRGEVGPFSGFSMSYLVRVDMLSGLDELRAGHGGYRISIAQWEIVPDPDYKGETAETALSQGSIFYNSIIDADPETTLTFWVYPDSFAIYRKLQAFAHEQGFPVAARPLPHGVAISGSPQGTKSASQ